eukprot:TRINITY_DN41765_c0_g1_i1.p1 TRINITY_DN41765_c0_g1~~TRINITY_DN41765_c0_g1_i1.p1  ORF type:complete len:265 (-),score=32.29 TRINITY_DN41765_c0_g1_i1:95-817(-)
MGNAANRCGCTGGVSKLLWPSPAPRDIVVIVGPSGVGKSTLIKQLMEEHKGCFGFSVSHTTRQPRPREKDGVDYNFTSVDTMKAAIQAGKFIEHAEVHGNFYGTSFEAVRKVVDSQRICLLDIDVQGAQQMKKSQMDEKSAYIFVAPPSIQALEERLRGRGTESEEKILLRLSNARKELKFAEDQASFFDQVLVNDDVEKAYASFRTFMQTHCRLEPDGEMSPGFRKFSTPRPVKPISSP